MAGNKKKSEKKKKAEKVKTKTTVKIAKVKLKTGQGYSRMNGPTFKKGETKTMSIAKARAYENNPRFSISIVDATPQKKRKAVEVDADD